MTRLLWCGLALQICAAPVFAQTTPTPPINNPPPSAGATVITPTVQTPTGGIAGANSFTESQARSRLESVGYSQVGGLAKGDDGIWRGSAMRNGAAVRVGVDYKGNVLPN